MYFIKSQIFSRLLVCCCLFLGLVSFAYSQYEPAEVKISNEKVIVDGKFYYLHTVKEKQTFYSICRAYSITPEKVLLANPGLIPEDLNVNQVLKIPYLREYSENQVKETEDFFYHTVEKGQTLYQIHRQYNVGVDVIKKHNPDIYDENISVGQVIKIPKAKEGDTIEKPDSLYEFYYVKPGDRLYQIAELFDIRLADIVELNQNLRYGLKPGERLVIPKEKFALYQPEFKHDTTVLLGETYFSISQCDSIRRITDINTVSIALMLPFGIVENITYDTLIIEKKDTVVETITKQVTRYSDGIVEFYEGMLLAADSIRKSGVDLQIDVYNTNGDTNQTKEYLSEMEKVLPDIIIGPYKSHNINLVANFAKSKGVLHILPFSNNTGYLRDHPTCFEVFPPEDILYKEKAKFLAGLENTNIFYVSKDDSIRNKEVADFDSLVNYYKNIFGTDSLQTAHIYFDDSTEKNLYDTMRVQKLNMVVPFFHGRKEREESNVINLYSNFVVLRERYEIAVMGNYEWQSFPNLRLEPYHDFRTHLIVPFYIDYRNHNTLEFAEYTFNHLGFEPYRTDRNGMGFNFAYLGFETTMLFVNAYIDYGVQITGCSNFLFGAGNQSKYHFKQIDNGLGFYNSSYTLLLFDNDYNVKVLKRE